MSDENSKADAAHPVERLVMPRDLTWVEREGLIEGTELFAEVPMLEHSVGPAGYTIRKDRHDPPFSVDWWHGNRGYFKGRFASLDDAKRLVQEHFAALVAAWTRAA